MLKITIELLILVGDEWDLFLHKLSFLISDVTKTTVLTLVSRVGNRFITLFLLEKSRQNIGSEN